MLLVVVQNNSTGGGRVSQVKRDMRDLGVYVHKEVRFPYTCATDRKWGFAPS